MNTKNKGKTLLFLVFFTLSLTSVSQNVISANSKKRPTNKNITFKLFPGNYFINYDVSADLTGTDNQGTKFTGNVSEKVLPKTTYMGNRVIPIETVTTFVSSNMGYGKATLSSYYSTKVNDRRFLGVSGDITTMTAAPIAIPVAAKIGDSGKIGTYIDSRNFKTILSWKLNDGFNGKALLILMNTTNKPSGILDNTFKASYLIQINGKRESVKLETYNDTIKLRVTLEGKYKT